MDSAIVGLSVKALLCYCERTRLFIEKMRVRDQSVPTRGGYLCVEKGMLSVVLETRVQEIVLSKIIF